MDQLAPEKYFIKQAPAVLGEVDQSLIKGMVSARKAFNALLDNKEVDSASDIQQVIKKEEAFLLDLEKTFDLELQFLIQQMGPQGEERVLELVMSLMPKPGMNPVPTMSAVLASVADLQTSKLLQMQSKGVQGQLQAVRDMIQRLQLGKPPGIDKHSSVFAQQVASLPPNFYIADTEDGSGERLYGKEALLKTLAEWEAILTRKNQLICKLIDVGFQ